MPHKGDGLFIFITYGNQRGDKKNIQIIALNNLIEDYTSFLEVCKNPSERELTENIISEAKEMILEYQSQIKRPQWKKDPSHP